MRFVIFTHVEHSKVGDDQFAYAPYVREMNLWLRQVEEVEIVAPLNNESQTSTAEAYRHDQVTFTAVPAFDLLTLKNSLRTLFLFPMICARILAAMHRADHLHLRCPGNIGLLACICQVFFPSKPKSAKYAGNWDPAAKQPWTYKFQKWILSNTFLTRNMQVLVYGEWSGQSKNVVPFFTASFSEKDIPAIEGKDFSGPLTCLFVGNLVPGKRPLEAIKLVEKINYDIDQENRGSLEIYGDGPEREKLETYVRKKQLEKVVVFKGSRSLEELKAAYQKAHFVILPSKSEGWPKALAEGMFYGCIPIATPVSCVPWMLGHGRRGILLSDPLLDTFQKSRQFECPDEYRDVSRTGFSETPAYRRGRLEVTEKEFSMDSGQRSEGKKSEQRTTNSQKQKKRGQRTVDRGQWTGNVKKISQLMDDPAKMKQMSEEAKKWSQHYTVEKFEAAIVHVLKKKL